MAGTGRPAVEIEGATELRAALRRVDGRIGDLSDTHREAGELVLAEASHNAPVKSGRLRDSLRVRARKTGAGVLAGGARVPYTRPIHFGWPARNIEPQPFLYDALDSRRDAVADTYRERVAKEIRRLEKEAPR